MRMLLQSWFLMKRGRIHECVFGVLVLESEPVDPRL
jgi:hypothetical protein